MLTFLNLHLTFVSSSSLHYLPHVEGLGGHHGTVRVDHKGGQGEVGVGGVQQLGSGGPLPAPVNLQIVDC